MVKNLLTNYEWNSSDNAVCCNSCMWFDLISTISIDSIILSRIEEQCCFFSFSYLIKSIVVFFLQLSYTTWESKQNVCELHLCHLDNILLYPWIHHISQLCFEKSWGQGWIQVLQDRQRHKFGNSLWKKKIRVRALEKVCANEGPYSLSFINFAVHIPLSGIWHFLLLLFVIKMKWRFQLMGIFLI